MRWIVELLYKFIKLIEKYEYRKLDLIQYRHDRKILESHFVKYDVLTDDGYLPCSQIHLTVPFEAYRLETNTGRTIHCADHHIMYSDNHEKFATDFNVGDKITTIGGTEYVTRVIRLNRKVSMFDLSVESDKHMYYTDGFLSHNTVTSAIFITWFMCFNFEKNTLVIANKLDTTTEIIEKIKTVYINLPFFLKPGVLLNNQKSMIFDNGCRMKGQATTKTAGIGFTIHLLYADEFAHIPANMVNEFYRSLYPTLSSSKVSRMIVTSTANGRNKFWEIYDGAQQKTNSFNPIRVDWWDVPGRDEEWKEREIGNLGSVAAFAQEYGNQFITDSNLVVTANALRKYESGAVDYNHIIIEELEEITHIDYSELKWNVDEYYNLMDWDKFVVSIDISDGNGQDYQVANIFKLCPFSVDQVEEFNSIYEFDYDFFYLKQIGVFHTNTVPLDEFGLFLRALIFDFLGSNNVRVVLEMNHRGNEIVQEFENENEYYDEMFLRTYHRTDARVKTIGLKITTGNKGILCTKLKKLSKEMKIICTHKASLNQLSEFGVDKRGRYVSQGTHDDLAMTFVNAAAIFDTEEFGYLVSEYIDYCDDDFIDAIETRLNELE